MEGWKVVCKELMEGTNAETVAERVQKSFHEYQVYPNSIRVKNGACYMIARVDGEKKLVIAYKDRDCEGFCGTEEKLDDFYVKHCELNDDNCSIIRRLFPFTKPASLKGHDLTIGLGDRLGLASPGHIRVLKGTKVFPVLAQQSIRELNLTGRTYVDVLRDASWAVFQEGLTSGFGADGDHLKTAEEVQMALNCGYTMITLDCSEHINNEMFHMTREEIREHYRSIDESERKRIEAGYLDREFKLKGGTVLRFTKDQLAEVALVYLEAIRFAVNIYRETIQGSDRPVDFEMSIDETKVPTVPEAHFFVANELIAEGVEINSLAPRFCGEFQKGIDYIGDIEEFRQDFDVHVQIADTLGYKISVHSGSDKFSVFPIIGEKTHGRLHLKTAGTNWLEAVRVIASKDPCLYREMHRFALEQLPEAKKYYHITENTANIPDLDTMKDAELDSLMDLNDARQVLHVTYGLILQSKNPDGSYRFRDRIYKLLDQHESDYYSALEKHIGKHIEKIGC
jgi:hypothetical protein